MPAVTVVMPAFNTESYIQGAIASVLRQTMAELELIVVDDGSSDRTFDVARQFADSDPRVRVLHQENAGCAAARNAAIAVARGRYIAVLDSDDEWDRTFLAEQLAIFTVRPDADVVIGNARIRGGPRDGEPARPIRDNGQPITAAQILGDEDALFIMAVFRRRVIDALGGYDPRLRSNEDYELYLRAALAGFTLIRNPSPLGWYTCRSDSLSASDTRMLAGALRVLKKVRPGLSPGSTELAVLDRQAAVWEQRLAAARARASLARGDRRAVARDLAVLYARRRHWLIAMAARLPRVAVAAYRLRDLARRLGSARGVRASVRHAKIRL